MSDIPAREMTLEEWVGGLPDGHRARKELAKLEAENEAWRNGLNVYQMPQGDWAFSYSGIISDGFKDADEAIQYALLKETD